jgi:hypothetical protein
MQKYKLNVKRNERERERGGRGEMKGIKAGKL